jgi:hypothetical protein
MATIENDGNRKFIDYMARDYQSFRQTLIDLIPSRLPEWTDRSESDFGIVLIDLFAHMADILSYYQDRIANEAFLETAQERRSILNHLRLIGYEMAPASAASTQLSLILGDTRHGVVEIRPGDRFATTSSAGKPAVTFEYIEQKPLIIDSDNGPWKKVYKTDGSELKGFKQLETCIPVREGKTVNGDVIGVSDGSPNQRYSLSHRKLLRGTLSITVETSPPTAPWRLRENLIFGDYPFSRNHIQVLRDLSSHGSTLSFSRGGDPDFAIETDENDITSVIFGDGQHGRIPPPGARIIARYRIGGGLNGNVGSGLITTVVNAPQLQLIGAKVTNKEPASGGAERESIEHAIKHAPSAFSSMHRAVTAEDYVSLAKLFPGVSKARAEAANWNQINLFIAPMGSGQPVSDVLERDLLAFFENKRMLTTRIEIIGPEYIKIHIGVIAKAVAYLSPVTVAAEIESTIKSLFDFEKMEFGQTLYISKIYEALEALAGVDFVYIDEFKGVRNDANNTLLTASEGTLLLGSNEIPVLDKFRLTWKQENDE